VEAALHEAESLSPLDGRLVGTVALPGPGRGEAVAGEVAEVQPFWAQLPAADRARYMGRAAQVLIDNLDELSALLAREHGRPRTEAVSVDLVPAVDALRWLVEAGPKALAPGRLPLPLFLRSRRARRRLEPLGVVGVVADASDPWSTPFLHVATALMAGNGVVLTPSAPLAGERIRWVFERAGVPEGVVRTVHGEAPAEPLVARSFRCGPHAGAAIVCADANLPNAVAGCLWGAVAGGGGIAPVYAVGDLAERFADGAAARAEALRTGDPMDWTTEVGPMPDERYELMRGLLDDAVGRGATLRCGGPFEHPRFPRARFFKPAVLTGVTADMRVMTEDAAGPLLPVVAVESEDEAIELASAARPGRDASVWTTDRPRGERIAARLDAGTVWINDRLAPWRPQTGLDLHDHARPKLVTWAPSRTPAFWWHPYDASLPRALDAAAKLLYGRDADKRAALARGAMPIVRVLRRALRR
jgi:succinate-semialdehyde dehydrogenase / glutarate-semialdehyde dehydrogenase